MVQSYTKYEVMKNIQKIADEIFQAPTQEELFERIIANFTKNLDGTYSAEGHVKITPILLKNNKLIISFKDVIGDFLYNGFGITSLEGVPKTVGGLFDCSDNELTSLKGCPKHVGSFDCSYNNLTSLRDGPQTVDGNYRCYHNYLLDNLEGAPKNALNFDCSNNELISLKGSPEIVRKHFRCWDNKLTSLEGAPKIVYGSFDCQGNRKKFTEAEVRAACDVKGPVYVGSLKYRNEKHQENS